MIRRRGLLLNEKGPATTHPISRVWHKVGLTRKTWAKNRKKGQACAELPCITPAQGLYTPLQAGGSHWPVACHQREQTQNGKQLYNFSESNRGGETASSEGFGTMRPNQATENDCSIRRCSIIFCYVKRVDLMGMSRNHPSFRQTYNRRHKRRIKRWSILSACRHPFLASSLGISVKNGHLE